MSLVPSRLLVIDACVARAAGETAHPVSSACREFLNQILEICHNAAWTPFLKEEWDNHQSGYAVKWKGSMARKGKPLRNIDPAPIDLDLSVFSPTAQDAISKDLHLLEAAFAAEKEIVTLDDKLILALKTRPEGKKLLKQILWHHPVNDGVVKLQKPRGKSRR